MHTRIAGTHQWLRPPGFTAANTFTQLCFSASRPGLAVELSRTGLLQIAIRVLQSDCSSMCILILRQRRDNRQKILPTMDFPIMAKNTDNIFILDVLSILMVFYEYFDYLLTPLWTKWQRFTTFLPAIGSFWRSHWSMKLNEPVINIHILTSFTRRRKRQRSPRVWISAVLIFHSGDSEPGIKSLYLCIIIIYSAITNWKYNYNNSHDFEHLGMENKINQDCEAVYYSPQALRNNFSTLGKNFQVLEKKKKGKENLKEIRKKKKETDINRKIHGKIKI